MIAIYYAEIVDLIIMIIIQPTNYMNL